MRLYLDDDSCSSLLVRLLRQGGHDVQIPPAAGIAGAEDPIHLAHAVLDQRALLTHNHDDFRNLHELGIAMKGRHFGILVVRRDNNPKRDLSEAGIVRALRKLLSAGVPTANEFIILNQWR